MEIVGTIKRILDVAVISDKFSKSGVVIETDDKYPQTILVEFTNDNITQLDSFAAGDVVCVKINIRGREWQSPQGDIRYFVSLNGWSIGKAIQQSGDDRRYGLSGEMAQASIDDAIDAEQDDLPF